MVTRSVVAWFGVAFCSGSLLPMVGAEEAAIGLPPSATQDPAHGVTRIDQVRALGFRSPNVVHGIRLEGAVWWVNSARRRMVLRDASGAELLEADWEGPPVRPGQQVCLEGVGTITRKGVACRIGAVGSVVDNDGIHPMIEKSGTVYLRTGRQPIRVEWFNGAESSGLEVAYEGPGLSRQRIPEASLYRRAAKPGAGVTEAVNGLEYRCYEGSWQSLPDFERLVPIKIGATPNFDLRVRSREEEVALQFMGDLDVRQEGAYTFHLKSDDGSRLFAGRSTLQLHVIGVGHWPAPRPIAVAQAMSEGVEDLWGEMEGHVSLIRHPLEGLELELTAGAGRMRVELADAGNLAASLRVGNRIRATGFCQSAHSPDGLRTAGILWVPGSEWIQLLEGPREANLASSEPLPVLKTAAEVHQLKREEAQRAYPARLQGVVTSVLPERQAFTIQDATRGLYVVDSSAIRSGPPQIGDYLELEGTTDPSLFAPIVNASRVTSLGAGVLPEPAHPTWDQLMNGSLDAQYVEIPCVITAVRPNGVTLLTPGGLLQAELRLNRGDSGPPERYENALVRVRGCLFAQWDYVTHQVKAGEIRVYDADIFMDRLAPADLFSSPRRSAAELRLFDPQAGALQRVRVSGQIVYVGDGECFMMDGNQGARFMMHKPIPVERGDFVDVVGFPDPWGSASPVLREAVVRRTGRAPLPEPRQITAEDLMHAVHDATRIQVEGVLVNVRKVGSDQVLEMQSGIRSFAARCPATGLGMRSPPVGSRLRLTGVYAAQGGIQTPGQDVSAFEVLLASASDIEVRAKPPWWTLKRLLMILSVLACVLVAAALWITQLHRQVEQRTTELENQIRERQRAEHHRALEEERARIAQDLHDELGSGITEVSMLAARAKSAAAPGETRSRYLDQVGDKAREMVTALDEIVWAMNPRHDSLASLVSYFCLYADRFLGLANIAWRLDGQTEPADQVVSSRQRHQLFLAFKEALTNVVRHSGATEVLLCVGLEGREVRLSITDNGRGLPAGTPTGERDGVANMRARIERLGGRFELESEPGRGTRLRFRIPTH